MLRLNIERLVRQRGEQRPQAYLILHGFTRNEARSILNPKLREVKLRTLERLRKLFCCEMNDLFRDSAEGEGGLGKLNGPVLPDADGLLEGLSPKDIAELHKLADEKRKR